MGSTGLNDFVRCKDCKVCQNSKQIRSDLEVKPGLSVFGSKPAKWQNFFKASNFGACKFAALSPTETQSTSLERS